MGVTAIPMPADDSDQVLIAAWLAGDEAAASALVERHTNALARFLAAAGAREDLEDLVQETFVKAFRSVQRFKGSASFRTWLLAIGSNTLKDARRKRRPQVLSIEDREIVATSGNPHDGVVERDLLGRLQEEVGHLPPMQRDVFLMRAQQGAAYDEIAAALGTSEGAARVHYHHAVKRLKAVLD